MRFRIKMKFKLKIYAKNPQQDFYNKKKHIKNTIYLLRFPTHFTLYSMFDMNFVFGINIIHYVFRNTILLSNILYSKYNIVQVKVMYLRFSSFCIQFRGQGNITRYMYVVFCIEIVRQILLRGIFHCRYFVFIFGFTVSYFDEFLKMKLFSPFLDLFIL